MYSSLITLACALSTAVAAPFSFPLPDGFPNPSAQQLIGIQKAALGTLPNGAVPSGINADSLVSLQLIAFNEIFEVAYFTQLLNNVTNNVPGYNAPKGMDRQYIINALTAIQAQEQMHALNANGALKHFGQAQIQPCKYNFPVDNLHDAITLAATFTDLVLGTLAEIQMRLGQVNDAFLIPLIGSVIGQEGEQNGIYRFGQGKVPSSLPFLTAASRDFAFTAIQEFTVPGSCPSLSSIPLKTFQPVTIDPVVEPKDQTLSFGFTAKTGACPSKDLHVVYINQQNTPIVVPVKVTSSGVDAAFPYTANELNGLTIAALVDNPGPFATAGDVAASTIYGPGLIEIN